MPGSGRRPEGLDEPRLSKAVAAGASVSRSHNGSSRHGSSPKGLGLTDWAVGAMAAAAALVAATAPCSPIAWGPGDALLTAGFAAGVVVAASKARRWTWLVLAGIAALTSQGAELLGCAALAVILAFVGAAVADHRARLLGAAVGALAIQVLLRQPVLRYEGISALITAVAVLPVFVSGYRMCRRRTKKRLRRVAYVGCGVLLLVGAGFAVAVAEARTQLQEAVTQGRTGLDLLRAGDQQGARQHLEAARSGFSAATATLNAPTAAPARAVPFVGQQLRAARAMSASGSDLMGAAAVATSAARYEDLKTNAGQVNLPLLGTMQRPVMETADALGRADQQLDAADSSWLVPPLAKPLHELHDDVRDALPQARLAADAIGVAPDMLGASKPRRYLLAFGTPAESRFLGGFIGSYAELRVTNGKIELMRSGSIQELSNRAGYEARSLTGMGPFLDRYGRFQPTRFLQNDSASPDFPTVAEVLRQLYPQAGGASVDGVIYIDPYGLAALLKVTGPVQVEGLTQALTAQNAAQFLLKDQYIQFANEADGRADMLARATKATFEALTSRQLPGPKTLADDLGPMIDQHRIMFTTFDGPSRDFLTRAGATGAFPTATPQRDFFSFRTSNGGANKIDAYLERSIDYRVRYAPDRGTADITATVTLRNTAPGSGLPDYVIGNTPSLSGLPAEPKGTNLTDFSLYADAKLVDATIDGAPAPVQVQEELGHHVYSGRIVVPPQSSAVLVLHLQATVSSGAYRLDVVPQPAVTPDRFTVAVEAPGWSPAAVSGWPGTRSGVPVDPAQPVTVELREDQQLDVGFAPAGG